MNTTRASIGYIAKGAVTAFISIIILSILAVIAANKYPLVVAQYVGDGFVYFYILDNDSVADIDISNALAQKDKIALLKKSEVYITSSTSAVRRSAARILCNLANKESIPFAVQALNDTDAIVVVNSLVTLKSLRSDAGVPAIRQLKSTWDRSEKYYALKYLGILHTPKSEELLFEMTGDADEFIREMAKEAIKKNGSQ
jgi:HEAT repeat protein